MKKGKDYLIFIRKYEILLASSAVLVLVMLLVFNMLLPNLNRANQIRAQGQTLAKKVSVLRQKEAMLSSLDYQGYKDTFLKLNQVLPEGKDYVSLINTFNILENKAGVTITRTDFQLGVVSTSSANLIPATGTSAYVIPVTVGVMGGLASVRKFLDAVANISGRLMVFDDMSVNVKADGILDVTFTGRAFFYPLPTTLGAIDVPLPKLEKSQEQILQNVNSLTLSTESQVELDKSSVGKKNLFQ